MPILTVQVNDLATEILVLNHELKVCARGITTLTTDLPNGLYKIRLVAGGNIEDKLIELSSDKELSYTPPIQLSIAPLGYSSCADDTQRQSAVQLSEHVERSLGKGATIFIHARFWGKQKVEIRNGPGAGITLQQQDGTIIADLGSAPTSAGDGFPSAGMTIEVEPGSYILSRRYQSYPDIQTVRQTVVACPGWQTQVFILHFDAYYQSSQNDIDLVGNVLTETSISMSHKGFDATSVDHHITNSLRLLLAQGSGLFPVQLLPYLNDIDKLNDPMIGIFGAHLLLLERQRVNDYGERRGDMSKHFNVQIKPGDDRRHNGEIKKNLKWLPKDAVSRAEDRKFFDEIILKLRATLGTGHPDVEALSLCCSDKELRTRKPFNCAPMLWLSWSIINDYAEEMPELLPVEVWDRYAHQFNTRPFLCWKPLSEVPQNDLNALNEVISLAVRTAAVRISKLTRYGNLIPQTTLLAANMAHRLVTEKSPVEQANESTASKAGKLVSKVVASINKDIDVNGLAKEITDVVSRVKTNDIMQVARVALDAARDRGFSDATELLLKQFSRSSGLPLSVINRALQQTNNRHYCLEICPCSSNLQTSDLAPKENKTILVNSLCWPLRATITIRFLGGDEGLQQRIFEVAQLWTKEFGGPANLIFKLVKDSFANIRVSFQPGVSWSYIGKSCNDVPQDRATMNFGWLTKASTESETRSIVLHEFGHALGLCHGRQKPTAPIRWNESAMLSDLSGSPKNLTADEIRNGIIVPYQIHRIKEHDASSIMNEMIPSAWTDGSFVVTLESSLSKRDHEIVALYYY